MSSAIFVAIYLLSAFGPTSAEFELHPLSVSCADVPMTELTSEQVDLRLQLLFKEDFGMDEYFVSVSEVVANRKLASVRLSLYHSDAIVLDTYIQQHKYDHEPGRVTVAALVEKSLITSTSITFDYMLPDTCPDIARFQLKLDQSNVR